MFCLERIEPRRLLAAPFVESAGLVVVEAESFDANLARAGKAWSPVKSPAGFGGSGAMAVLPNTGSQINTGFAATSPQLDFAIKFVTTGVYRVWLRARVAVGADDSAHVGLDGKAASTADNMSASSAANWTWFNKTMDGPAATINITSAGVHKVNLWMREDGIIVDRIILTKNTSYAPSGTGPAESPREQPASPPPSPPPPPPPPPPAPNGSASPDPELDAPWNIRRLTQTGERPQWSPDGSKIAYIAQSFGDAYEIDIATGQQRLLTGFFSHKGFLRVQYMPDGNFLLTGARTFKDINTTRYHDEELWVLPNDLSTPPVALNQKVNEETAISATSNKIAWTVGQGQYPRDFPNGGYGLYTGEIVYIAGAPTLINKQQVYYDANYLDVQDFRDNDNELVFNRYVKGSPGIFGVNLITKTLKNYRDIAGEYNEGEGLAPDGNWMLVESTRDKGAAKQTYQYIDLWLLDLTGSGKPFQRLVRWGDYANYKSSNPVVSPDGGYIAFQSGRAGEAAGVGHGIFLLNLRAASAQTIFSDDFASTAGWTTSAATNTVAQSNGAQVTLGRSNDGASASVSITRTFDTTGFGNISLNLEAFQSAATFEKPDALKVEVDTGAGFVRLLTDGQAWQGIDAASGDDVAALVGTTAPIPTGYLALQSSAANNAAVRIRITGTISADDERYFLDSLRIIGVAIA